jgi:hypothetical protein
MPYAAWRVRRAWRAKIARPHPRSQRAARALGVCAERAWGCEARASVAASRVLSGRDWGGWLIGCRRRRQPPSASRGTISRPTRSEASGARLAQVPGGVSTQPIFEFVSPVGGFRANRAHPQAHRATPEAPRLCAAPSDSFRAGSSFCLAGVRTASRPASRARGSHIGTSRRASGAGWRRFRA